VYDVEVHNQREERIAAFRGRSYRLKGKPVVDLSPPGG
jgi:acyl-CoA thioesterase